MSRNIWPASAAAGAILVLSAAAGAFAQENAGEPGLYVSGGGTYFQFEGDNGVEAEVGAITGRAGMQFNSWLSLEGDASFGIDEGDFDFDGDEDDLDFDDNSDGDVVDAITAPGDFGLDYLLAAYVKAGIPVGDQLEIFGRAGYAFAEVSSEITTPGGNTIDIGDSESGASLGAGGAWHLTDRQSIRVDYTFTDFDLAESNSLGLMYQLKF